MPARPIDDKLLRLILFALMLAAWSGCASFAPPVRLAGSAVQPGDGEEDQRLLRLELVEGRPQGLVLRITSRQRLAPGSVVTVYRQAEGQEAGILHEISVDDRLVDALAGVGIEFVDPSMQPGERVRYFLLGESSEAGEGQGEGYRSEVAEVAWRQPPARPARPSAQAPTPVAVELSWDFPSEISERASLPGTLVFRRDLLHAARPVRRLIVTGEGCRTYVDREVEPGGVYAYRVAFAWLGDVVTQYGVASEEVYVTVPGADEPFEAAPAVDDGAPDPADERRSESRQGGAATDTDHTGEGVVEPAGGLR